MFVNSICLCVVLVSSCKVFFSINAFCGNTVFCSSFVSENFGAPRLFFFTVFSLSVVWRSSHFLRCFFLSVFWRCFQVIPQRSFRSLCPVASKYRSVVYLVYSFIIIFPESRWRIGGGFQSLFRFAFRWFHLVSEFYDILFGWSLSVEPTFVWWPLVCRTSHVVGPIVVSQTVNFLIFIYLRVPRRTCHGRNQVIKTRPYQVINTYEWSISI